MVFMPKLEELSKEQVDDIVRDRGVKGWIKAWFAIELMAVSHDITEKALREHVDNLESVKEVFVFKKDFKPVEKLEIPPKGLAEAYSQVAEINILIKDMPTLINIVMAFGPSSVEILEPKEVKIRIDEVQSIANLVAAMMHQFASAGVGGLVFTPQKNQKNPEL